MSELGDSPMGEGASKPGLGSPCIPLLSPGCCSVLGGVFRVASFQDPPAAP